MKKLACILFLTLFFGVSLNAQKSILKTKVNYFIDNTEFDRSTVNRDQTMTGTHLQTLFRLMPDSTQSINVGVDLLTLAGGMQVFERPSPIVYYKNTVNNMQFLAGAFPRKYLLDNYSDFFFQDSVLNYRPLMHGLFWNVGKSNHRFFNVWLDWISMKQHGVNDAFFIGSSAKNSTKGIFAAYQAYMFHYGNHRVKVPGYYLCDNALLQVLIGYELENINGLKKISISSGILAGYERERDGFSSINKPVGFVSKLELEHKYFGLESQLYLGDKRQVLYPKYGNRVYWNNSFLRAGNYLENKIYIKLFNNKYINARFTYNLHISEGQLFHEQAFSVNASTDILLKRN